LGRIKLRQFERTWGGLEEAKPKKDKEKKEKKKKAG